MGDIVIGIMAGAFLLMTAVGLLVYRAQKRLDAPYGGILVVERNKGEPAAVYFQAVADPGTFTDGQDLKLKVRVLESQQ